MNRRRVASLIFAVLLLFLISSGVASAAKGDCNYDREITAVDALMALKMSVGTLPEDLIADMNEDNEVTSFDAALILQLAVDLAVAPYRPEEFTLPEEGVYINPIYQEVQPEDTITVSVEIKPADLGVSAGEISLGFDPAALEATSLEPGGFLDDTPLIGLNEIDNEAGTLRLAIARVGETTAPSSPGVLAIVTFTVLETAESGTYELTLTEVRLIDQNFEDIADIPTQGASIEVIQ